MTIQSAIATDDALTCEYLSRLQRYDWSRKSVDLNTYGAAVLPGLLSADERKGVIELSSDPALSRTSAVTEQLSWGSSNHRYFRYPIPSVVGGLRTALYLRLIGIANDRNERMEFSKRYPKTHGQYLQKCHDAGQTLSTSMLLDHTAGQYTPLHQDLYGALSFPLQVAILLSQPGGEFTGGEFVITEQRPRMQTRPEVVALNQGDAVIFAVSNRPVTGTRGTYRVNLRHGFSKIRTDRLRALSILFHDAAAQL